MARPTVVRSPRATGAKPTASPGRDTSVDAIRALCLVVVVALHATMVGVGVGPHGVILENALEGQSWFAPVSWFVQVMPLFFIAGGFSAIAQWQRMRAAGATTGDYVRSRLDRLLRPAIALVAAVGVGLAVLGMLGVPADVVATAGFRISQPLWFLAVYLGCSALVPQLVAAHERARFVTPLVMLSGVIAVDLLRVSTGIQAIGFLNLALVWLLVQQLGFHLADGSLDRLSTRKRIGLAGGALALLAVFTASGAYSPDMYVNLNPPTLCLVVLGAAQLLLFSVAQPRLRDWMRQPAPARIVAVIGARSMTIYLWHMSVLVALAGVLLLLNGLSSGVFPLPDPLSAAWWITRPLWLVAVGCAVIPVVRRVSRFETDRRALETRAVGPRRLVAATILGVFAVVILLVIGVTPVLAAVSVCLMVGALRVADVHRVGSADRLHARPRITQAKSSAAAITTA